MGDDIGLGSVTDCLLRSFSDLKRQTELHYVDWAKNNNKQNPNRCHHPLITQFTSWYIFFTKIPKLLKYGFCKKLHWYKWTSDHLTGHTANQSKSEEKKCSTGQHSKLSSIYHMPNHVKKYTNAIMPMVSFIWIKWSPEANKLASFPD